MPLVRALAWPPIIVAVFIVAFTTLLPGRYGVLPGWAQPPAWIVIGVLVVASLAGNMSVRFRRLGLVATVVLIATSTVLVAAAAVALAARVMFHGAKLQGVPLLTTSVGIWIANIIVFALWYWLLDRGGPYARHSNEKPTGDLMFPQDSNPEFFANWKPSFIDYLFVAFNTSTAFSPTETFPITARAKVLMLGQASVSLTTIVVVAARAINILS
jgi:hypothetical protein